MAEVLQESSVSCMAALTFAGIVSQVPKKSSNEVLRPSGPAKKGWQLRGIRRMTFSIPQEEQSCNYSN